MFFCVGVHCVSHQMQIDLTNKVIILDEAHNMEDNSREAASLSINSHQLGEIISEIEDISKKSGVKSMLRMLTYSLFFFLCSGRVKDSNKALL